MIRKRPKEKVQEESGEPVHEISCLNFIRGRKRNQMLRRANEHGTYIDSKGQEQKRK